MNVLERFSSLTKGCQAEDANVENYFSAIEAHVKQMEEHCRQIRVYMSLLLNELNDEVFDFREEEPELPVEDYMLIRSKFGEEAANKMYYDVKFGKVPLRIVQRYLSQINTVEKK